MKTAIVTGASSGIGKAISYLLLQLGYKVYGISRTKPSLKNPHFVWIKADLLKSSNYIQISKTIKERIIDVLVNNAGIAFEENSLKFNEESFDQMFGINYKAPILMLKILKKKLYGSLVINISSVSDRLVGENYALYCSSKTALNVYFDVIALEERNIKIISILPSYVDTPLLRKLQRKQKFDWSATLKPGQVAEFVVRVIGDKDELSTGSKVIVVTDKLKEDLKYEENLWGYNATDKKLVRLSR